MGTRLAIILSFLFVSAFHKIGKTQPNTWVWVNGNTFPNDTLFTVGIGIHDTANHPPGLYQAAHWVDNDGNFWIFGGNQQWGGETSDLLKFTPSNPGWTLISQGDWIGIYGQKGVPSSTNHPGDRAWGAMTWTDLNGNLWLFGGTGRDGTGAFGRLNDMWKYDISSHQWTWMSGSNLQETEFTNYGTLGVPSPQSNPGYRAECNATWVDKDGNLWLFGGEVGTTDASWGFNPIPASFVNDIWKYDVSINQWAWMGGEQGLDMPGSYGTKGIEAPGNAPPSRACYSKWQDGDGNLYIYGGINFNKSDFYNDVWRYNPQTMHWTWIAGVDTPDYMGNYKDGKCVWSKTMMPWCRGESRSPQMAACQTDFLIYGGFGGMLSGWDLNDLWSYNVAKDEWLWITGSETPGGLGVFGNKGIPSTSNSPKALAGSAVWMDRESSLWVFGGLGKFGMYNTMWKYTFDSTCFFPNNGSGIFYTLSDTVVCSGDTVSINLSGSSSYSIYPPDKVIWQSTHQALLVITNTTTFTITANTKCSNNDVTSFTVQAIRPTAAFSFVPASTTIDRPTVEIANQSSNYSTLYWLLDESLWQPEPGNKITFSDTGVYCLKLIAQNELMCTDTVSSCITVLDKSFIAAPDAFSPNGDGVNDYFTVFGKNIIEYHIRIYNRWGELVYESNNPNELNNLNMGWDGKHIKSTQNIGNFAYEIKSTDISGNQILTNGSVILIK